MRLALAPVAAMLIAGIGAACGSPPCSADGWCRQETPATEELRALGGTSGDDVWAAGRGGQLVHWDGAKWTLHVRSTPGRIDGFKAIWALRPDRVWFAGDDGRLVLWNGSELVPGTVDPAVDLRSYHSWEPERRITLNALWGSGEEDVWVVGDEGLVLHFDGSVWSKPEHGPVVSGDLNNLTSIAGAGPDNVWIGGWMEGQLWHFDGTSWSTVPFPIADNFVSGLWAGPDGEVWATSLFRVARRAGGAWQLVSNPGMDTVGGISAANAGSVWTVGDCGDFGRCGAIARWDGTSRWIRENEGVEAPLTTIWSGPSGEVWAAGDWGTVLRRAPK